MAKAAIISIAVILLLLASFLFFYTNEKLDPKATLDSYNARKEDLYLSMQRIEAIMADMDKRIQEQESNQIAASIINISAKADLPPPVINTTRYVQEPPVTVTVPREIPSLETSTPVTRGRTLEPEVIVLPSTIVLPCPLPIMVK